MSYSHNNFYDQAYIPCNAADENAAAETGIGQVNIDGKVIKGGININDTCYFGGVSVPGKGYSTGKHNNSGGNSNGGNSIFYAGGGGVPYTNGYASATNTHTIRALRANRL